jgi:hypothetical protein
MLFDAKTGAVTRTGKREGKDGRLERISRKSGNVI